MGAYFNAHKLRIHPDFIGVVHTAATKIATDIYVEPENTANHARRLYLARVILFENDDSRQYILNTFVFLCAADNAIRTAGYSGGTVNAEAVPDNDLTRVIGNAWLALAGTGA